MWWALPLVQQDIDEFAAAGYSNEFLRFMQRVHNPSTRTLLVSANDTNAKKLGSRVDYHFKSNAVYRTLFPETLPTAAEIWSAGSMHVHRPGTGGVHGEGTFDYLGVGGALQSRHYDRIIQDDLVGMKAIESESIMDKTIDYHKLVLGAFESDDATHENDEIIVGNRWGYADLNSYIREEEPWFRIETHSALGGCCARHPLGVTIFPEMFDVTKLAKFKQRLGAYLFSCQFLNDPSAPETADFKIADLRFYDVYKNANERQAIRHEVEDGVVMRDSPVSFLSLAMVVDPNHSGNEGMGRSRHAICVVGISDSMDYYLLEYWADRASYDTFFSQVYKIAENWGIREVGFETIAAQKYAKYHIEQRNMSEKWPVKIIDLNGEVDNPGGGTSRKKEWRIRNVMGPIFERRKFWIRRGMQKFIEEYKTFPKGKFMDILDALAYAPQLLNNHVPWDRHMTMLNANRDRSRRMNQPYATS